MHLRLNRNKCGAAGVSAGLKWTCAAGFMFFLIKGIVWLGCGGLILAKLLP